MDRRRPRPAPVGLAVWAAAGALALAAPAANTPLRAMRWAPKDVDPVANFARAPTECLARPSDPAEALKVEVGRAAFRTPVLLGGQAARAGVSCDTCHTAGRRNGTFLFPGVSGPPGTADVSNSLFSSHHGDDLPDPAPIPDLSGPKSKLFVDQRPGRGRLEYFIHSRITGEFDGLEPPKAVLAGLADYLRHLSPQACPAAASEPVTPAYFMSDVRRALAAAKGEIAQGDAPSAILMIASARTRLGLIDERYGSPELASLRGELRAADARLAAAQAALRAQRPGVAAMLDRWLADSVALQARLEAKAGASLFDPA